MTKGARQHGQRERAGSAAEEKPGENCPTYENAMAGSCSAAANAYGRAVGRGTMPLKVVDGGRVQRGDCRRTQDDVVSVLLPTPPDVAGVQRREGRGGDGDGTSDQRWEYERETGRRKRQDLGVRRLKAFEFSWRVYKWSACQRNLDESQQAQVAGGVTAGRQ